jgi:hypothetical protein
MEKMPANGMKRVWVRPKLICIDHVAQKTGEYFLVQCGKGAPLEDIATRQANFVQEYPEYAKQVIEIVTKQYTEQEFIDLTWGGMFRSLRNLLIQSKTLLSQSLYNVNVLMIDDYSGPIQSVEPKTTGRGQMVLLSHYYRFTKSVIAK